MLKKEYIYSIIIFPWFFNFVIDEGCGLKRNSISGFGMSFLKERRRLAAENECFFFFKQSMFSTRCVLSNTIRFLSGVIVHFGAQLTSISVANTWSLSRKYVHKNALQFPNSEIVLSRIPRHATF